jgi:quercetin dioxygenase-like cupin family protein
MTMHGHKDADEFIFVLDGEANFEVDEKEIKLGKGSAILIPKQVQHRAFNNNEKTCLCLYVVCPLE